MLKSVRNSGKPMFSLAFADLLRINIFVQIHYGFKIVASAAKSIHSFIYREVLKKTLSLYI